MEQQKKSVVFGYLFLLLISAVYSFSNTSLEIKGMMSTSVILVESLIFLSFLYFVGKYNLKKFWKIVFLLSVGCIHYVLAKETVFLVMIMVAVIFTELDYKKAFRLLFYERFFFLMLIICFSLVGVLSVHKTAVFKGGIAINVFGYGLGFNHPNQLAYNVGLLLLLYICYKGQNIRQRHLIGVTLTSIVCYMLTKTRTILIIGFFLLLMLEIYYFKVQRQKATEKSAVSIWKFAIWIMPICALGALGLPLLMSTATGQFKVVLSALNGLSGSRFTHSARVFDLYSIPLWGGIVDFGLLQSHFGYSVVDNGYLCLLYDFGVIGFSLFIIMYFRAMKKLIDKKQYIFLITIIAISLWGITENVLRSFAINFTVAFWAECIIKDELNCKIKKDNRKN